MSKVAVVTGASNGIGLAIAKSLVRAEYTVVSLSRTSGKTWVTGDITQQIKWVTCNLEQFYDVEDAIEQVNNFLGPVEVLVNNAAILHKQPIGPIHEFKPIHEMLNVNIYGPMTTIQKCWQQMKNAGKGTIVNIGSLGAWEPFPGLAAYGGTKAFITAYTRAVAREGDPYGIKAYVVAPGAVETNSLRRLYPDFPADKCLQPEQVADVVMDMVAGKYPNGTVKTISVEGQEEGVKWEP